MRRWCQEDVHIAARDAFVDDVDSLVEYLCDGNGLDVERLALGKSELDQTVQLLTVLSTYKEVFSHAQLDAFAAWQVSSMDSLAVSVPSPASRAYPFLSASTGRGS